MKSKVEELKQFNDFLESLEPGGYLDLMFGRLQLYVEKQMVNDMGVDINNIIKTEALLVEQNNQKANRIVELEKAIERQVKAKEDYQADYERGLTTITEQEKRIKNLEEVEDALRAEAEQAHMRAQNYQDQLVRQPQLEEHLRIAQRRAEIAERKMQALKARIYDLQEDWQTLNAEKKEEVAKLREEISDLQVTLEAIAHRQ